MLEAWGLFQKNRGKKGSQVSIISKQRHLDFGKLPGGAENSYFHTLGKDGGGRVPWKQGRVQGSGDSVEWTLCNKKSLKFALHDHPGGKERAKVFYLLTLVHLEEIQQIHLSPEPVLPGSMSSLPVLTTEFLPAFAVWRLVCVFCICSLR